MLKMIHGNLKDRDLWDEVSAEPQELSLQERIEIKDACWPAPFEPGLEYNSPAHGNWNIVHTGMLLPEAHQIYVCAANCNRGVVLTAAEMNASHRFSFIELCEQDLYSGEMEDLVINGVGEILNRLDYQPRIILLFTVCLHHFMGVDLQYIYQELRSKHPQIYFVDCYMDCIMQKEGLSPDQKLRIKMYDVLEKRQMRMNQANIVGSDFPLRQQSEIMSILRKMGWTFRDLTTDKTMDQYLSMGESCLNICTYPPGKPGLEILSRKLGIPGLYLPMSFDFEEIDRQLALLTESMRESMSESMHESVHKSAESECRPVELNTSLLRERCRESLEKTARLLQGKKVVLDISAVPQVLGLAKFLLSHGIEVTEIFGDAFLPEEHETWLWLKENAPRLVICSVIHHNMRVRPRIADENVIAVGQKAAYFHQTPYFVNIVEGGGLHGYDGILTLLALVREACTEKKDIEDTIKRKGLGCPCVL